MQQGLIELAVSLAAQQDDSPLREALSLRFAGRRCLHCKHVKGERHLLLARLGLGTEERLEGGEIAGERLLDSDLGFLVGGQRVQESERGPLGGVGVDGVGQDVRQHAELPVPDALRSARVDQGELELDAVDHKGLARGEVRDTNQLINPA